MCNITGYNKRIRKVFFFLSQYSQNKVPKGICVKAIAVFTESEGGGEKKGKKQKEKEKKVINWEKEKLMFENQSK